MEKNNRNHSEKSSNFVVQGSILAVAGIFVRLIGMLYKVPMNNIIGDEGNGYYNAAFSVYSILLIVSSYSLPVAVSKMVAARLARKEYRNAIRILYVSLFYATIAGGIGFGVLYFGADAFGEALKMPYSSYALRVLAPTVWIMAYLGVLRGYFQGQGNMVPTAISQIFEQIVNAVVSLVAADKLFRLGVQANLLYGETEYSFAYGAAGGNIGTGAGALTALLFFLLLMYLYRRVIRRQLRRDRTSYLESYGQISMIFCLTVLPVLFSATIYNISSVLDNYIFGNIMDQLGKKQNEIAALLGIYGRYHLLFNIPVAISNSLSSSLIPALSRAVAERNRKQVLSRITMAIRFSMIVSIPAAVGLTVLAEPIANLLFTTKSNGMLVQMMVAGSAAVVFYSLSTVTNGVLQGINRMRLPIRNATISLVIHIAVLLVLMKWFRMGIYSVIYSNMVFALCVCILNSMCLRKYLRYKQEIKKTFLIPLLASGIMGLAAWVGYQLFYRTALLATAWTLGYLTQPHKLNDLVKFLGSIHFHLLIGILGATSIAVLVYGFSLIKLGGINEEELSHMPKGKKLVRISKKLHLLP